ncbi:MAG: hypothetical protein ACK5Q5_16945 [Planctomycetaceae bacterium]
MSAVLSETMTLAEFNDLPDDPEVNRELIFSRLEERPMTRRNRWQAGVEAAVSKVLGMWCDQDACNRGRVFSGEVDCELPEV